MKTLYVFAGNNGSGKSTFRSLIKNEIFTMQDIDDEYIEQYLMSEGVSDHMLESGKVTIKRIQDNITKGVNFSFETTLSSKFSVRQIIEASNQGYYVVMYYLYTDDIEINMERALYSRLSNKHKVRREDFIRRDIRSIENLVALRLHIDKLYVNNTGKQGERVAEMIHGAIFDYSTNTPVWLYELY